MIDIVYCVKTQRYQNNISLKFCLKLMNINASMCNFWFAIKIDRRRSSKSPINIILTPLPKKNPGTLCTMGISIFTITSKKEDMTLFFLNCKKEDVRQMWDSMLRF